MSNDFLRHRKGHTSKTRADSFTVTKGLHPWQSASMST